MPEPQTKKKGQGRLVLVGAAVGLLAYLWYKRRKAATATPATDTTGLSGNMPGGAGNQTTAATSGPPTFNSLPAWMAAVQTWANALGFDPATIQNALQHYMIGQCLSAEEYKIINLALGVFGQPPEAPSTGIVQCQPSPGAPSTPGTPAPGEPFLGSGFGPPGFTNVPSSWLPNAPPSATEEQVLRGLDGNCYLWIPNTNADKAIGPGQTRYIEPAPRLFVPAVNAVPGGTAALYVQVPCPASTGVGST